MRDRWEPIDQIFADALERPTADRERFVIATCGGDDEVAGEVLALLRSHDEARLVLGESAAAYVEPLLDGVAEADLPRGRRVGPYRIVREIGRSDTGRVYLAEGEDELRRQVALRLLKPGLDTEAVLLRFRYERRTLAALVHPNIARLYDVGVHDGLPYLVTEYVEGQAITGYCEAGRLGLDARLALFRTVCVAVQFAHRQLVAHGDLKSSGILVTAGGTPKLLDVGVARLFGLDAPSTGTDVYALGVLLYEMLTGTCPTALNGQSPNPPMEQKPAPPSAAASTPRRLRRRLRGDLDNIALKALETDPRRRYQSAMELVEELDRHVSGIPVRASRQTVSSRVQSFLRRHGVAATVAAALVLLAMGIANVHNDRVTRERDRARADAARTTATAAFVTGLFQSADLGEPPGDSLKVLGLLDQGARRLTRAAFNDPEVQARLQTTLGWLYLELSDYPKATSLLDSAVVLRRAIHGSEHEAVAGALRDAAEARTLAGDYPASDSLFRQALAIQLSRLGPSHPEVAITLNEVADMLARSGRPDSVEPTLNRALTILQAAPDDRRGDIATSKFGLAVVKRHQKAFDQAETLLREVLALRRELSGGERSEVATLNELGSLYLETGRYDRAAAALQESLAIRRNLFASRSRVVARGLDELALMAFETGRDYAGADSLWHEALALWAGISGRNDRNVGMVLGRLGQLELHRGNADSALVLFVAAREAMRNVSGELSADAAHMTQFVGIALQRTGHFGPAQAELEWAVEIQTAVHGPSHLDVAAAELSLADILRDRLDFDDAEARYAHALGMLRDLGAEEDVIGLGLEGYGRLRLLEGRELAADSLLREALAIAQKHYKEGDQRLAQARTDFGLALLRQRRPAEAESLLVGSFPQLSPYEQPRGRYILAELYDRLGRPEVAETYRDRVTSAGAGSPDRGH